MNRHRALACTLALAATSNAMAQEVVGLGREDGSSVLAEYDVRYPRPVSHRIIPAKPDPLDRYDELIVGYDCEGGVRPEHGRTSFRGYSGPRCSPDGQVAVLSLADHPELGPQFAFVCGMQDLTMLPRYPGVLQAVEAARSSRSLSD